MEQMNLTLAIKANNKGVSGTVRETAREVRGLQGSLTGTATAAQANTRQMAGLTTAGQEANRMFRLQKGSLQQAGYQFQDLAIQIGGGTSAFVAIGQQGSQLLSLLGPGGALLGAVLAVSSAFGGALYSSTTKAAESTETLRDRVRDLELGYEDLTVAQRKYLEMENEIQQRGFRTQISDREDQLEKLRETIEIFDGGGLRINSTGSAAGGGILGVDNAITAVNEEEYEKARDELVRTQAELDFLKQKAADADREYTDFVKGLEGSSEELENNRDRLRDMVESLESQAFAIGKTEREITIYEASLLSASEAELEAINRAYDAIEAEKERQAGLKASAQTAKEWSRAQLSAQQNLNSLVDRIDPLGAELRSLTGDIEVVQTAFERGLISAAQADDIVNQLVDPVDEASKEAAEQLVNRFDSAAQSVAIALQSAIAAGDWEDIGDVIGNTLATTAAGIVSDQISNVLAEDLTKDSGMLAQIGAAFAGPVAGAVVGGVAQLAMSEIADWLSGDDWDPTEDRQARQGTGTVLGDINAKSESIRRAVEGSESGIGQLVGINQGMLQALQTLQLGIGGAVDMVARQRAGLEFSTLDRYSQGQLAAGGLGLGVGGITTGSFGPLFGAASGVYGAVDDALGGILTDGMEFLDNLTGGLLSDIGSSVFGGDQKVVDEGVRIIGGNLNDLVNKTLVQAYATIKEDGGWFSSDKRFDRFQDIATNQFSLVFESISDAVARGAEALGMGDEAAWVIDNYMVGTARISLEGLNAEEQRAEIEAHFGTIFDDLSGRTIPFLDDFQRAGEGLGETLARVANQTLVTQEAVNRLGVQFTDLTGEELVRASERLMEAGGGVEQFIASMEGFIDTFASDARQFELAQSDLSTALGQANLAMPATRDGYYELLRAQNGATEAGAKNIATLLKLRDSADEYYTYLEDSQAEATRAQRGLLGQQRSEVQAALREAEQASGAIANALGGMLPASAAFQQAERGRALDLLRGMARSGSVSYDDTFTDALSAATSISARDYGSMADYIRDAAATGAVLTDLQAITDEQVAVEERMLDSLDRQLDAVESGTQAIVSELTQIERTLSGGSTQFATSAPVPVTRVSGVSTSGGSSEVRREIQLLRSELSGLSEGQRALTRHAAKATDILEYIEVYGVGVRS